MTIVGKVAPVSRCVRGSTGLESQPFVNEVWKGCFELSAGLFLVGYRHGRLGLRIKRFDDIICLMGDLDRLSREGRAGGDRDRVSLHALLASCEDVVCFVSFVQNSAWAFAAVQLVIFMASGFLQMRRTNCQSFRKIIAESFNVGLPCNTLQRMFLEEKTFEAPLSLFVQLLESGHLVSS